MPNGAGLVDCHRGHAVGTLIIRGNWWLVEKKKGDGGGTFFNFCHRFDMTFNFLTEKKEMKPTACLNIDTLKVS